METFFSDNFSVMCALYDTNTYYVVKLGIKPLTKPSQVWPETHVWASTIRYWIIFPLKWGNHAMNFSLSVCLIKRFHDKYSHELKQHEGRFQWLRQKRRAKSIFTQIEGGGGRGGGWGEFPETGRAEIEHTARSGLKKCGCYFWTAVLLGRNGSNHRSSQRHTKAYRFRIGYFGKLQTWGGRRAESASITKTNSSTIFWPFLWLFCPWMGSSPFFVFFFASTVFIGCGGEKMIGIPKMPSLLLMGY